MANGISAQSTFREQTVVDQQILGFFKYFSNRNGQQKEVRTGTIAALQMASMGNQADMPGVNVVPIVAEAPAPPNGAADVDPHNSAVVVDGAVAVAAAEVEIARPP